MSEGTIQLPEVTKMVIATSMRAMFKNGGVSICDIDQCLKLAGIIPMGQAYQLLRTLHCVKFEDMPRELAEKIPELLKEVFSGLSVMEMMKAMEPAGGGALQGFAKKLLN